MIQSQINLIIYTDFIVLHVALLTLRRLRQFTSRATARKDAKRTAHSQTFVYLQPNFDERRPCLHFSQYLCGFKGLFCFSVVFISGMLFLALTFRCSIVTTYIFFTLISLPCFILGLFIFFVNLVSVGLIKTVQAQAYGVVISLQHVLAKLKLLCCKRCNVIFIYLLICICLSLLHIFVFVFVLFCQESFRPICLVGLQGLSKKTVMTVLFVFITQPSTIFFFNCQCLLCQITFTDVLLGHSLLLCFANWPNCLWCWFAFILVFGLFLIILVCLFLCFFPSFFSIVIIVFQWLFLFCKSIYLN